MCQAWHCVPPAVGCYHRTPVHHPGVARLLRLETLRSQVRYTPRQDGGFRHIHTDRYTHHTTCNGTGGLARWKPDGAQRVHSIEHTVRMCADPKFRLQKSELRSVFFTWFYVDTWVPCVLLSKPPGDGAYTHRYTQHTHTHYVDTH